MHLFISVIHSFINLCIYLIKYTFIRSSSIFLLLIYSLSFLHICLFIHFIYIRLIYCDVTANGSRVYTNKMLSVRGLESKGVSDYWLPSSSYKKNGRTDSLLPPPLSPLHYTEPPAAYPGEKMLYLPKLKKIIK